MVRSQPCSDWASQLAALVFDRSSKCIGSDSEGPKGTLDQKGQMGILAEEGNLLAGHMSEGRDLPRPEFVSRKAFSSQVCALT